MFLAAFLALIVSCMMDWFLTFPNFFLFELCGGQPERPTVPGCASVSTQAELYGVTYVSQIRRFKLQHPFLCHSVFRVASSHSHFLLDCCMDCDAMTEMPFDKSHF